MKDKASTRLVKGTVIYMIGNLTSKVLQMLILPVISASLHTSEYGYYDLIVTTINLVTPLVTFQVIEGMFRYMFSESIDNKKQVVSTVTVFLLASCVVLGGIMTAVGFALPIVKYPFLIYLNYVSAILFSYSQKLSRCEQKNRAFAISGVIHTIIMLTSQAVTLLVFKMGVEGMLISNSISYVIASIYLFFVVKVNQWIDFKAANKTKLCELLKFSAPLIPNSLCWWMVASSDRYVITMFLGTGENGIYSMAGKFSQLLTFVTSVFQLAWQESAIIEADNEQRDAFYTKTFNTYMRLLMGGYLVVLPLIKFLIPVLLDESYQIGYLYNPILLMGAVFSALSQFYGSAYLAFKKTKGAFYTTVIAAVINIAIGVGLIRYIGLFAPALGTAVSFMIQWIIRSIQMKSYFRVRIEIKVLAVLLFSMSIVTVAYYFDSIALQAVAILFGNVVFFFVNRSIILQGIRNLKSRHG